MKFLRFLCLLSVCACASSAFAKTAEEKRFEHLAGNYRCVVCQGQSVLESDSEIAKEFKTLLQQKIDAGQSDAEIDAFFYERYGDFVFFNPKKLIDQFILWAIPMGLFVVLILMMVVRRKPVEY